MFVDFLQAAVDPTLREATAIGALPRPRQARRRTRAPECRTRPSLRTRSENARARMRPCSARRSHSYRAEFILQGSADRQKITPQNPAMTLDLSQKEEWEVT